MNGLRITLWLVLLLSIVSSGFLVGSVSAETLTTRQANDGCVIPESGPWPPCATGGAPANPPADTSNQAECIIPESGPWPPCATNGGGSGPVPVYPTPPPAPEACVIPESGPWPPCATDGSGTNGVKTHRMNKWQVRQLFMEIFNNDFGMADGEHGYINRWQDDTKISFNNGVMRLSSAYYLENGDVIYHDYGASFSAESGDAGVETRWLEIGSRQVGGEDLRIVAEYVEFFFRFRLFSELGYSEIVDISLTGDEMIVTYR